VLTRIESQIAGGRVPRTLNRIGMLRALADFNPFDRLELLTGHAPEPTIRDCGSAAYLMGRGLRAMVDEMGIQRVRSMLNEGSPGNASRMLRKYGVFLPREIGIDGDQLFQRCRESVSRQLAA
jgi:hypothetical protein